MLNNVINFLSEYNNIDKNTITGESKLILDLGLSSFELIEICCQIEEEFNIRISDENLAKIVTVNDILTYFEAA